MAGVEVENVMSVDIDGSGEVDVDTAENVDTEKTVKLIQLPLTRIKHIMKMDPDVNLASQESVVLLAKAAVRTHMNPPEMAVLSVN